MPAIQHYTKEYIDRSEGQTHLLLDQVQSKEQIFLQSVLLSLDRRFANRALDQADKITESFNSLIELRIINQAIMAGRPIVFPDGFPYESVLSFKNGDNVYLTREKLMAFVDLFFKQLRQIYG
ncbi:hypothetical protein [Oenococcus kitaharae]|uniref:Uncharacterized protein n=1 Tax=Oenococcus kitaharae DSM 17330 TaxID=1045004 RepID=G9WHG6_9LACO|nr:hypothetical protein [Oenococcus kitaharae]EHN58305.1 hypothetical protein OKIT_0179 [Oenococcus kitaharae DSM 17330]